MEKFTFLGKKVALSAFLCCFSLVGFAQEDTQTFNFDATETQEYAAFFKQPSAIEGKCNAEVMGIDINREGFSWDDMNTWKNSEGKIWLSYSDGYVETLLGYVQMPALRSMEKRVLYLGQTPKEIIDGIRYCLPLKI